MPAARYRPRIAWLSVAVVIWATIYWYDVTHSLAVYDESIYAASARLAVEQGYVLYPHIQGGLGGVAPHPFLEKPPLVIWLQAVSIAALGPTEAAIRLPSQLSLLGAAGVVYTLGDRLRSHRVGGISALVFLTTPQLFEGMNGGRTGGTDPVLLFFGSLSLALVWIAVTESRDWLLVAAGVAGGLAAMAKGPAVGFYVLAGLPLGWLVLKNCDLRYLLAGLGAALVVGGWWPVLAWITYGDLFLQEILFTEVVQPGSSAAHGVGFAYLEMLPWAFGPWLYLLPLVAAPLGYTVWTEGTDAERFLYCWLWWWAAIVFVVVLVVGEHTWYVMPIYTPLALLVGWGVSIAIMGNGAARAAVVLGTVATLLFSYRSVNIHYTLVVVTGGAAIVLAWPLREVRDSIQPPELRPVFRVLLLACVTVGSILLMVPVLDGGGSGVQRSLGQSADDRMDGNEVLLTGPNISGSLFPLGFYSGSRLEPARHFDSAQSGQLAVVNSTQSIDRSYVVVKTAKNHRRHWVLVRFQ